jgi:hypothetical protein
MGGDHAAPRARPIPGAAMHPAAPPAPAGDRHGLPLNLKTAKALGLTVPGTSDLCQKRP